MRKLKLLVLTDHTNHNIENSVYPIVRALRKHLICEKIDVVSRGNRSNDDFFEHYKMSPLQGSIVNDSFNFHPDGRTFFTNIRTLLITDYDAVWLRLPPPLNDKFLSFLEEEYPNQLFINAPAGINKTGSKEFLLNFKSLCAPMKKCTCIDDIVEFKERFPIVLKPFKEYGGRGIIKIDGGQVWDDQLTYPFDQFVQHHTGKKIEYLGVQYLKNVDQGDKRIVVVSGQIMGASLRLPAKDSWICNVSMGGTSGYADVDEHEIEMISQIDKTLSKMGIVMYGIDTLVGNDGKRVLSEINTTSIGGLPQIAKLMDEPLLEVASDLIWKYISENQNVLASRTG